MHGLLHLGQVHVLGRVEVDARVVRWQHPCLNEIIVRPSSLSSSFQTREKLVAKATYAAAAAPLESELERATLVARRRVDAVDVDVALLLEGPDPCPQALPRWVDEGGLGADLEPALQGLVGDEAVVPPVLEHAGQVSVVVDQTVPDLELLKFNVHLFCD